MTTTHQAGKHLRCLLISAIFAFLSPSQFVFAQQQQDPSTLNGGSIMAMCGRNCLAIAVDKRFGSGPQMVTLTPRTVLIPHSELIVAFAGLEGDVQSLSKELSTQISSKMNGHLGFGFGRDNDHFKSKLISPKAMSSLLSHSLYKRRGSPYYVEPIVAGLQKVNTIKNEHVKDDRDSMEENTLGYIPFICSQDLIGAKSESSSFACAGAASKSLYGTAEAMWRSNLAPEELLQVCGRAFLSGLERDCMSGYGAVIYLLVGGEGILEYDLACRND